jgi:hydrogenase maturation protease
MGMAVPNPTPSLRRTDPPFFEAMSDSMHPHPSDSTCHASGGGDTVIVLGIGNVLWADEGFGVRCVEALQERWDWPASLQLVDGGTQGLYLIQFVQAATHLLIFDAVDYGLQPGEIKVVDDDEVPAFMGAKKMSLHQTGFQEVLMLAKLTERYPGKVRLIGCQPEQIDDYGGSLSQVVRDAMAPALALGLATLKDWGVSATPRQSPLRAQERVTVDTLALAAYEAGRPSASEACRVGDARFMPNGTRAEEA